MTTLLKAFSTSVGTKIVIGLTGLALVGFLILHLVGNLLMLGGADLFNEYSHKLISNPLLIPAEIALLGLFLIHVYKAVRMFAENQRARPTRYYQKKYAGPPSRKSLASSTMIASGLVTFVFVVLHLKTFKYGHDYPAPDTGYRDLYRLVIEVFSSPGYVAFYVFCMLVIGMHLRHGIASAFQSLGIEHPRWTRRLLTGGKVLAVVIAGGFALIPVWVFFTAAR
jgi:succinate dehydrogenase / fumarate reductase cytochrome b subunit